MWHIRLIGGFLGLIAIDLRFRRDALARLSPGFFAVVFSPF
jgi:hypothetical protein